MRKRALDFSAALAGLVVLAPVFLFVAILLKIFDRGPVFFGQVRVGMGGRPFRMWKFRSMRVGGEGRAITVGADPRITPLGAILRKTKIDELPQLFNVLRGDMSLVGPRPEVPKYVDLYSASEREVLESKPGITDPSSFALYDEAALLSRVADPDKYYREILMPEKIRINLEYARRAGFFTDLLLIVATVGKILGLEVDVFKRLRLTPPKLEVKP